MTTKPTLIYLGTEAGVRTYRQTGDELTPIGRGLEDEAVRAIAVHPGDPGTAYVGCGLRGWGLHRTTDAGRRFEPLGFDDVWVWDVTLDPTDSATVYVGTEPPALHVSHDGGRTFARFGGLERLPSRDEWTFFHEPFEAGHVHGLAVHEARPDRLFAGVEHGALVYTRDGGDTWHEALVGRDLHRVEIDPTSPDRVFAGAGGGLFVSEDAGATWSPVAPLRGKYVHGIEFDPHTPDRLYVYVDSATSPLYRSDDAGATWEPIGESLPTARPADTLVVHPTEPGTLFYAGDEDEESSILFVSRDAGDTWESLADGLPKVWRAAIAAV